MKTVIFLDMDGVLATYHPETVKYMYDERFFAERPVMENMIMTAKMLIEDKNLDVYVLSSVLSGNPTAIDEKNEWLDINLPELQMNKRIYVPVGVPKIQYLEDNYDFKGLLVLIDDYSENLIAWKSKGHLGIKVENGVNGNHGKWARLSGANVSSSKNYKNIYKKIKNIIKNENILV